MKLGNIKEIKEISEEKKEWLKEIGAVDIEKFKYLIPTTQHMFSLEYLSDTSIKEIKQKYENLYSKFRKNSVESDNTEKQIEELKKELRELKEERGRDKEWQNYLSEVSHYESVKTLKIIGLIGLIAVIAVIFIIFNR